MSQRGLARSPRLFPRQHIEEGCTRRHCVHRFIRSTVHICTDSQEHLVCMSRQHSPKYGWCDEATGKHRYTASPYTNHWSLSGYVSGYVCPLSLQAYPLLTRRRSGRRYSVVRFPPHFPHHYVLRASCSTNNFLTSLHPYPSSARAPSVGWLVDKAEAVLFIPTLQMKALDLIYEGGRRHVGEMLD